MSLTRSKFTIDTGVIGKLSNIYDEKFLPKKVMAKPFNDQCSHHIETSQLICSTNQLSGFYMIRTLVVKRLTALAKKFHHRFLTGF